MRLYHDSKWLHGFSEKSAKGHHIQVHISLTIDYYTSNSVCLKLSSSLTINYYTINYVCLKLGSSTRFWVSGSRWLLLRNEEPKNPKAETLNPMHPIHILSPPKRQLGNTLPTCKPERSVAQSMDCTWLYL